MKHLWRNRIVAGSSAQLVEGVMGTLADPEEHPLGSFSGSSTAILGGANYAVMSRIDRTSAEWMIDLELAPADMVLRVHLVVACLRHYGGCHCQTRNQRARVALNGVPTEHFRLATIPPTHDDYFYRPPVPAIPLPHEIAVCQTVYVWPVLSERLAMRGPQVVRITIDPMVRWDIDYIGFVYEVEPQPDYDFALSFAGEDRAYVEKVAELLRENGTTVFYDLHVQADLWGANLYEHLTEVYRDRARFVVLFASQHYRANVWPNLERRAAQAKALLTNASYILPARFDDTEIPGLLDTVGYLDLKRYSPAQLVGLLLEKLRSPKHGR